MVKVSFFVCYLLAWNIHYAKRDIPDWQTCNFAISIMQLWGMIFSFSQIKKVLVKAMPLEGLCCSFVVSLLRIESCKVKLVFRLLHSFSLIIVNSFLFNSTPNDLSVP